MTEKTPCMAPLIAEHEVDYGPLAALAGAWYGESGTDVAPEPDGKEINPFYETIVFTPAGDTTNAEEQTLVAMHYHQVVRRKSDHKVFHNETGFWLWEPATGRVTQTLTIPRGVSVIAEGRAEANGEGWVLEVETTEDGRVGAIAQTPFLAQKARTLSFTHRIEVAGDTLRYTETTLVDIYGRRFEHTDRNTLQRTA
ncbi:heme-binding beta-barrel domain-containing protein [Hahella sp. SMD15-11]|uniref:Heme-binding beta-barrel domain-containing protein n=1 Tax=Thermohahella caldifontis TaxID=3142973 RepID=A0AB39UTN8_9GAMM